MQNLLVNSNTRANPKRFMRFRLVSTRLRIFKLYPVLRLLFVIVTAASTSYASAGLAKDQSLTFGGIQRTYDIYTPDVATNEPRPLVLLLHGHGGDADVMTGENGRRAPYKLWLSIAEREGWYVVIPDGEYGSDNRRGWNDCRANAETNPTTDDVGFLNALVYEVSSTYAIDQGRVYAHGTSNGGMMAFRLAQESADKFKAVAVVVALMPDKSECAPIEKPISVLVMNGTKDPILPYGGGNIGRRESDHEGRGTVTSTVKSIQTWVRSNGIESRPIKKWMPNISTIDRSRIRVERYTGGEDNTEVVLYKVVGGGHTEPSLEEHYAPLYKLIVGQQNRDIEMAEEVWSFFERN